MGLQVALFDSRWCKDTTYDELIKDGAELPMDPDDLKIVPGPSYLPPLSVQTNLFEYLWRSQSAFGEKPYYPDAESKFRILGGVSISFHSFISTRWLKWLAHSILRIY